MKKYVSLFLASLMLFSFAACSGTEEPSSADVSETSTESSAEPVSEEESSEESSEEEFIPNPEVELRNSMLDGEIDRTKKVKNIFDGLTYTFSVQENETYNDPDRKKLTNGVMPEVFNKQDFVAWTRTEAEVVFDLGEDEHALADIVVKTLRQMSYGIGLPSFVSVFASDDGENYVELAKREVSVSLNDSMSYDYTFAFPKAVKARYIKIYLAKADNTFTFVSEILGYEYRDDGDIDLSFGAVNDDPDYYYDFYGYSLDKTDYG